MSVLRPNRTVSHSETMPIEAVNDQRDARGDHVQPDIGIVPLALWFGLLTGLGELALLAIKQSLWRKAIRFGPESVWMTPVADVLLFLGLGLILDGISRRAPGVTSRRHVVWLFVFLCCYSGLLLYYPIHLYAKWLLAAGLAAQAVRLIAWAPLSFRKLVRWTLPALIVLAVALWVGVATWRSVALRQHLAALPAVPADAPNVLLIVLDTVRAKSLSLYGYDRPTTPHLQRWAKRGVVFDLAISTAPWTLPSHASMFTGLWPSELGVDGETPLAERHHTLAEALSSHGYLTAGFVANTVYCGYEFGLAQGFAHYEDYVASPRELLISSAAVRSVANAQWLRRLAGYYDNIPRKNATEITDRFLRWLPQTTDRPFFAFLNYFDAHLAYLPPAPFARTFGPEVEARNYELIQDLRYTTRDDALDRRPAETTADRDTYDATILYLDSELNRLFNELQRRGVLERTLVIVTSDHGEQFGEHGYYEHGNTLYLPLLRVPLMILPPGGMPVEKRVPTVITLRDLPATVMSMVGIGDAAFPGRSLSRFWSDHDSQSETPVVSQVRIQQISNPKAARPPGLMRSLTNSRYHYIKNSDGSEELFDVLEDPEELRDISTLDSSRALRDKFRLELEAMLRPTRSASTRPPG
jgi:arylsulfatase A-like enzyme